MENLNSSQYLETVRARLLDNLARMGPPPAVPFHQTPGPAPRALAELEAAEAAADGADPDARHGERGDGPGDAAQMET